MLAITLGQLSAKPADDKAPPDAPAASKRAERLDFMKKSVAVYELTLGGERRSEGEPAAAQETKPLATKARLETEPVLRWSDIEGGDDGTLFLWTAAGRPVAAAQAFSVNRGKLWLHEFQSLSLGPFSLEREGRKTWTPAKAGIEFRAMPDAPTPAKTAAQRLSQMHAMARLFTASDDYGNAGNIWQLRLLSRPVYRYPMSDSQPSESQEAGGEVLDGALFAFVVGTDPEMLLLFEARREAGNAAWQYALAPMTAFSLKASLSDKAVWSRSFGAPPPNPQAPFFGLEYRP
jgi:hypothetical protein